MTTLRTMHALFGKKAGQGSEAGKDLRAIGIPDLTTILVIRTIPHKMVAIFNAPLTTGNLQ